MRALSASGYEELDRKLPARLPTLCFCDLPHTPAVPVRFCGEFVQLIASMVLEICQQGAIR